MFFFREKLRSTPYTEVVDITKFFLDSAKRAEQAKGSDAVSTTTPGLYISSSLQLLFFLSNFFQSSTLIWDYKVSDSFISPIHFKSFILQ